VNGKRMKKRRKEVGEKYKGVKYFFLQCFAKFANTFYFGGGVV